MPHLADIQVEALLEAGYVLALLAVALGLERMARVAHQPSERFETAGFRYHAVLDAWECPRGEHLALVGMNSDGRTARYRARATACNRCPIKLDCTDSDTGRELERTVEAWPRSDLTRYYRVLALMFVVLATFITSVGLVRHHGPAEVLALGGVLVPVAYVGRRITLTGLW